MISGTAVAIEIEASQVWNENDGNGARKSFAE